MCCASALRPDSLGFINPWFHKSTYVSRRAVKFPPEAVDMLDRCGFVGSLLLTLSPPADVPDGPSPENIPKQAESVVALPDAGIPGVPGQSCVRTGRGRELFVK
jgi:hypothetical protein